MHAATDSMKTQHLIPLCVLFVALNALVHFSASNSVGFFSIPLSKSSFILPMTLALCTLFFYTLGSVTTHHFIRYGALVHFLAGIYSQIIQSINYELTSLAWFTPFLTTAALLLCQSVFLYILSDSKEHLSQWSYLLKGFFAIFCATLVHSISTVLLLPIQNIHFTPNMAFFGNTLFASLLMSFLGIIMVSKLVPLFLSNADPSEFINEDSDFSFKVMIGKEDKIQKHISNIGLLTDRD